MEATVIRYEERLAFVNEVINRLVEDNAKTLQKALEAEAKALLDSFEDGSVGDPPQIDPPETLDDDIPF